MSSEPVILMRGVDHGFGAGVRSVQVLWSFALEVRRGEIVLLMGPSGCGKTTVLTLAGALRSLQSGTVQTLGVDLTGADACTMDALRRRVGFIFQSQNLHGSLTAAHNVRMGLEVHGPAALDDWRARCEAALDTVGMAAWADAFPDTLSGGQKQRVAIARALVARPRLILADEPTAALDRTNGRQTVDLLHRLAKQEGSAILMVTHDSRILDVADRILEMEDGRIVGSPGQHEATHSWAGGVT